MSYIQPRFSFVYLLPSITFRSSNSCVRLAIWFDFYSICPHGGLCNKIRVTPRLGCLDFFSPYKSFDLSSRARALRSASPESDKRAGISLIVRIARRKENEKPSNLSGNLEEAPFHGSWALGVLHARTGMRAPRYTFVIPPQKSMFRVGEDSSVTLRRDRHVIRSYPTMRGVVSRLSRCVTSVCVSLIMHRAVHPPSRCDVKQEICNSYHLGGTFDPVASHWLGYPLQSGIRRPSDLPRDSRVFIARVRVTRGRRVHGREGRCVTGG